MKRDPRREMVVAGVEFIWRGPGQGIDYVLTKTQGRVPFATLAGPFSTYDEAVAAATVFMARARAAR